VRGRRDAHAVGVSSKDHQRRGRSLAADGTCLEPPCTTSGEVVAYPIASCFWLPPLILSSGRLDVCPGESTTPKRSAPFPPPNSASVHFRPSPASVGLSHSSSRYSHQETNPALGARQHAGVRPV